VPDRPGVARGSGGSGSPPPHRASPGTPPHPWRDLTRGVPRLCCARVRTRRRYVGRAGKGLPSRHPPALETGFDGPESESYHRFSGWCKVRLRRVVPVLLPSRPSRYRTWLGGRGAGIL
jgi:hypothetical protein